MMPPGVTGEFIGEKDKVQRVSIEIRRRAGINLQNYTEKRAHHNKKKNGHDLEGNLLCWLLNLLYLLSSREGPQKKRRREGNNRTSLEMTQRHQGTGREIEYTKISWFSPFGSFPFYLAWL